MSWDIGNNGEREEMQELPLDADQAGLVGQTVYRDGRQREGACPEFTGEVLAAAELLGFHQAGWSQHVPAQCPPAPGLPQKICRGGALVTPSSVSLTFFLSAETLFLVPTHHPPLLREDLSCHTVATGLSPSSRSSPRGHGQCPAPLAYVLQPVSCLWCLVVANDAK